MDRKEDQEELMNNISIDEKVASGVYSNLTIVSNSDTEFVIDFASIMPGMPGAKVLSRIILTPENAKKLVNGLAHNIQRFEESLNEETDDEDSIPFYGEQANA